MTSRVDKDSLPLNQPRRTPSHPTKSHVVKTKVDGKEKLIRFGEQGASTAGKPKEGESDRMKAKRASFKSRHAKNIAKGPSSPAYWANKVKWADGGFVKTNYDDGGRAQTGAYVGYRSAGRRPESQQDRTASANAPLSAMRGYVAGTLGLPGDIEGLGRMLIPGVSNESYIPGSEYFRKVLPLSELEQTPTGRAFGEVGNLTGGTGVLGAVKLAGKTGKAGARIVGEELNRAILDNSGPLAKLVPQAAKPLYAVKPKGGNWAPPIGANDSVTSSIRPLKRNPEVISGDLINQAAGEDLWSKMVDENVYQYPIPWLRENRPDVLNKLVGEERGAVNKWLDTKLEKYIRNDMGTPDDPIRLAHEEGYSHIPGNEANDLGAWLPDDVAAMRVKAGYPEEGFAVRKHAEAGFPEATEANARKAEMWEALADTEITSTPAREFQNAVQVAKDHPSLARAEDRRNAKLWGEDNPWMMKLDRETPIYKIQDPVELSENLGFGHMSDEIQNMLDPESGLPAALRLTPKQLEQSSIKQMVQKVDAVNKWRAEEASKAELEGMMGNLTATPRLEVPEAQLSFVKEPGMKWVDIPDTVEGEGMKLCTTIGRQAGWCTQGEGLAERYGSGENRLTTLLDAEGRPHAQAMLKVMANDQDTGAMFSRNIATLLAQRGIDNAEEVATQLSRGYKRQQSKKVRDMLPEIEEEARRMIPADLRLPKPDITELKPVGNTFNSERASEYAKRDPQYKEKITDSVLKFLNAGEWGTVKDLHHYDIVDLLDTSSVQKALKDVLDYDLPHERIDKFNYAVNFNPESPRFMNERQFRSFVEPNFGKEGFKEGGSVDADEQAAFGIYPSAGKRSQKSDIGDKLNASLVPQDALDLALTVLPFGKVGKTLAAAIVSGAPAEAQAGNMSSLLKLVAREAPEQFQSIREALLRTFNTGLEHSVIGSTRIGGPSQVVQGVNDSVMPNRLDVVKARRNIDQSGLIDFHTHPRQNVSVSEFKVTPSDADLQTWMSYYGGSRTATTPNEIKTMVGSPPSRQDGVTSAYNFFATNQPNQTLNRRAYDAARYELQRSKSLQSLKDIPEVRQYLDTGGTLGDVLSSASPMVLQKLYAQKGLGRHDMRLSNAPVAGPLSSESNLFDQIVNPSLEVLKAKRFAEGGSVAYDPTQVDHIMNSIATPRLAEGGSVRAYDSGRVDAILNEFM